MSKSTFPYGATSIAIKIVIVVLALTFIKEQAARLPDLPWVVGDIKRNSLLIFGFWLTLLAPGFYLCAAWAASNVFGSLNKGAPFAPALVKGVREVGQNLMIGAITAIIIVPTVMPWLDDRFRGIRYNTEIESVTICLVGLVLYILAKQGQALKAELEQFV